MLKDEDFIICFPLMICISIMIFILGFRFGEIYNYNNISNNENFCTCCQDERF